MGWECGYIRSGEPRSCPEREQLTTVWRTLFACACAAAIMWAARTANRRANACERAASMHCPYRLKPYFIYGYESRIRIYLNKALIFVAINGEIRLRDVSISSR